MISALKNRIKKTLDRASIRPKHFHLDTVWGPQFLYQFIEHKGSLGAFLEDVTKEDHPLEAHRTAIIRNLENFSPYLDKSLSLAQSALIRHHLVELDFKTNSKTLLAVEVEQILTEYPSIRRDALNLASIPGFSSFTAVWVLTEINKC